MADWSELIKVAHAQEGLFSAPQAAEAGISAQLLHHHLLSGRIVRIQRGIYRLKDFPPGEHEDLVAHWLWSRRQGVFSHETALALLDLSDVLPARVHMTLPIRSRGTRAIPKGLALHFAGVPADEVTWYGPVPVTGPRRTLLDLRERIPFDILEQAVRGARVRGLIAPEDEALVLQGGR